MVLFGIVFLLSHAELSELALKHQALGKDTFGLADEVGFGEGDGGISGGEGRVGVGRGGTRAGAGRRVEPGTGAFVGDGEAGVVEEPVEGDAASGINVRGTDVGDRRESGTVALEIKKPAHPFELVDGEGVLDDAESVRLEGVEDARMELENVTP